AAGDQYQGGETPMWNYVYQNGFGVDDYVKSAELLARIRPDLILTGHWDPHWPNDAYFRTLSRGGKLLDMLHREVLPPQRSQPGAFGAGGPQVRIAPYRSELSEGSERAIEVHVRNPDECERVVQVELRAPRGYSVSPRSVSRPVGARSSAVLGFTLRAEATHDRRRELLVADVTVGDRRYGQVAEAIVTMRSGPSDALGQTPQLPGAET